MAVIFPLGSEPKATYRPLTGPFKRAAYVNPDRVSSLQAGVFQAIFGPDRLSDSFGLPVQRFFQALQSPGFVLPLASLLRANHRPAGGNVNSPGSGGDLVNILTTGPARPKCLKANVFSLKSNLGRNLFNFANANKPIFTLMVRS
jgi:hypothetical protein